MFDDQNDTDPYNVEDYMWDDYFDWWYDMPYTFDWRDMYEDDLGY